MLKNIRIILSSTTCTTQLCSNKTVRSITAWFWTLVSTDTSLATRCSQPVDPAILAMFQPGKFLKELLHNLNIIFTLLNIFYRMFRNDSDARIYILGVKIVKKWLINKNTWKDEWDQSKGLPGAKCRSDEDNWVEQTGRSIQTCYPTA